MANEYQPPAVMKSARHRAWLDLIPAITVLLTYVVYPSVRTGYVSLRTGDVSARAGTGCRESQPC